MSFAVVGIGIPGSGKTLYLKELAEEGDYAYVSKDAIREELLGSITDQSKNREVWLESNRRITDALAAGRSVILDSTHAERWKREELVSFLKEAGARQVVALYFDVPLDLALSRNRARERVVPESTLRSFHSALTKEPPIIAEGFDAIYTPEDFPSALPSLREH